QDHHRGGRGLHDHLVQPGPDGRPARRIGGPRGAPPRRPGRSRTRRSTGIVGPRGAGPREVVRAALVVLLLAVAAVSGCTDRGDGVAVSAAPRPAGDRAYGDTLIRGLAANISGLIPNIVGDKYSHDAVALVYNGLVTHDKDTNIIPD